VNQKGSLAGGIKKAKRANGRGCAKAEAVGHRDGSANRIAAAADQLSTGGASEFQNALKLATELNDPDKKKAADDAQHLPAHLVQANAAVSAEDQIKWLSTALKFRPDPALQARLDALRKAAACRAPYRCRSERKDQSVRDRLCMDSRRANDRGLRRPHGTLARAVPSGLQSNEYGRDVAMAGHHSERRALVSGS